VRAKISLYKLSPSAEYIPLSYNYALASAIYSKMSESGLDVSKVHGGNPLFVFSRLFVPKRKIVGTRMFIEGRIAYFYFSSPDSEIFSAFLTGLFTDQLSRFAVYLLSWEKCM